MGKKKYVFDSDNFEVEKAERKRRKFFLSVLKLFLISIALTVVYYAFFALFFSTDRERALQNENRMLERMYPEMEKKADLLNAAVEGLKIRDEEIYENIFEAEAPDLDRIYGRTGFVLTDSLSAMTVGDELVKLTETKADALMESSRRIESNMMQVLEMCSGEDFRCPPMFLPVRDFSMSMTGASVGKKMNPFYKVTGTHGGLDFMSSLGSDVIASADGTVIRITKSRKGSGNVVVLDHGGGYTTEYAHLQDIVVRKGASVKRGEVIGHVGMSGTSYAPHLHYEVRKDGVVQDPVNYFFGVLAPDEYYDMTMISVATGQSLD